MKVEGFDWDDGNWPKCGKHGLARNEIENVFHASPLVLPDRTPVTSEARFNAVGKAPNGRFAFIVFTLRTIADVLLIRPISARYMHQEEVEAYERREEG